MFANNGQWSDSDMAGLTAPSNNPANDSALRRALGLFLRFVLRHFFHCFGQFHSFHHALFEQPLDEPQNPPVGDVLAHQRHEPVMGNRIEVALDVHFHDVLPPCLEQFFHTPQRVFTTASGAEAVAVFGEAVFENGLG